MWIMWMKFDLDGWRQFDFSLLLRTLKLTRIIFAHQAALFPESLNELIAQDHPVQVIEAFVVILDLG
jgi:hypothetical protein